MIPTTASLTIEQPPMPLAQALRELEEAGADVVGFNCHRGPDTMLPLITEARKVCQVGSNSTVR